jgi:hypothetical protein
VGLGQWARRPWGIGKQVIQRQCEKAINTDNYRYCHGGVGANVSLPDCCHQRRRARRVQEGVLTCAVGVQGHNGHDPKQQQAINGLAQYRVSAVKYNGKLYYVFPTATKDKIYVGRQKQFNAYKQALAAQQASQPASQQAQPGQQLMNPPPTMTFETAGPNHIEVDQFDGFGPMGTASLGDW